MNDLSPLLEKIKKQCTIRENQTSKVIVDCSNWITEYDILKTSRTEQEYFQLIESLGSNIDRVDPIKVNRDIIIGNYNIVDTSFSLCKNFMKFQANKNEDSNKFYVEINFIYELPKLIYLISGKRDFNENEFLDKFSEEEYFILIELFTCIVSGCITSSEEKIFKKLISKDEILSNFIKNIENNYVYGKYLNIECRFGEFTLSNIISPTNSMELVREYICQMLSISYVVMKNLIVSGNKQEISLRSVNDYRFILKISKKLSLRPLEEIFTFNLDNGSTCQPIYIKPKIFKSNEYMVYLKTISEILKKKGGLECGN